MSTFLQGIFVGAAMALLQNGCSQAIEPAEDAGTADSWAQDAHPDVFEASMGSDAGQGVLVDSGAPEADTNVYCWHFVSNDSTWPNPPYEAKAAVACTGTTIGTTSWGYGVQPGVGGAAPCSLATCPGSDGVGCAANSQYGTVCCPSLHSGTCN